MIFNDYSLIRMPQVNDIIWNFEEFLKCFVSQYAPQDILLLMLILIQE